MLEELDIKYIKNVFFKVDISLINETVKKPKIFIIIGLK